MSNEVVDKGDLVRLTARWHNAANRNLDPTTVKVQIKPPNGAIEEYTYAGSTVEKDATGIYHRDVSADQVGTYQYRWISTGSGQAAQEGRFVVRPTIF